MRFELHDPGRNRPSRETGASPLFGDPHGNPSDQLQHNRYLYLAAG
jgi:hypothetical protein